MAKTVALIPAYNESKYIADVISNTKNYVDLVIVIDDGSTDKTYEASIAAHIRSKHITNLGKGSALKTGFELAIKNGADTIITIDADGQNDPKEIPLLLTTLEKHNADIVVGSRSSNVKMPLVFRFGNWFLMKTFQTLFHLDVRDTQSGFRAIRASIYSKISWHSTNYSVEAEMLANAGKHNLKCIEVPIHAKYLDRYKGTTIIDGISIFTHMVLWKLRK
jgi:glycosyltransferase involved in cell wall biosynthesis